MVVHSPVAAPSPQHTAAAMSPRRMGTGPRARRKHASTALLLSSFFALAAAPFAAAGNTGPGAQAVLPSELSPIAPLIPEPPAPAQHTFVSPCIPLENQLR